MEIGPFETAISHVAFFLHFLLSRCRGEDSWAELPKRPSMALNRAIRRQSDFYFPRILIYTGRLFASTLCDTTEERAGRKGREREIEDCSFTRIRRRAVAFTRGYPTRYLSVTRWQAYGWSAAGGAEAASDRGTGS